MGGTRSLKRKLKQYNVAVAQVVERKCKEKGIDNFSNRRSQRSKPTEETK